MKSNIRLLARRAASLFLSLSLAIAYMPAFSLQALADEVAAAAETSASNTVSYNADNVAVLAQTTFDVAYDGEAVTVTVPRTAWSAAAASTSRAFVAFATTGTRLSTSNPQLGAVAIGEDTETYAMRLSSASAPASASAVTFTGADIEIGDLDSVYTAAGEVGGEVSDEEVAQALEAATFDAGDDAEADVVEMPALTEETARAWAASMAGDVEVLLFDAGAAQEDGFEKSTVVFDISAYKGYYPDCDPLGDADAEGYAGFSAEEFWGCWMVDGSGYLWHVDSAGRQYFHGTSFYAVADGALNAGAAALSAPDEAAAARLAGDLSLEEISKKVRLKWRGVAAVAYIALDLDWASLSFENGKASITSTIDSSLDISYGTGRDTALAVNRCLNPKVPIALQLGAVGVSAYLSLSFTLDAFKGSLSYRHSETVRTTASFDGGIEQETVGQKVERLSVSGGFSASFGAFLTFDVSIGRRPASSKIPSLVSADAGAKLEVDVSGGVVSGCGDMTCEAYAYAQMPSVYDKLLSDPVNTAEPFVRSAVRQFIDDHKLYVGPLGLTTLASWHIEDGVHVKSCTKKSTVITADAVSFSSGTASFPYTGKAITPAVEVLVGSKVLAKGTDYTVSYKSNVNAGTAKAVVKGAGSYTGTVEKAFTITKEDISKAKVSGVANKNYTGSARTLDLTVKFNSKTLTEGTDYKVTYSDNTNIGTATVTVAGKGSFKGSVSKTFEIKAKFPQVSLGSDKQTASSIRVVFKLKAKAPAPITRVRAYYGKTQAAAKKKKTDFKGKTDGVKLQAAGDTESVTVKDLKAGTTYYFLPVFGIKCAGEWYYSHYEPTDKDGKLFSAATKKSTSNADLFEEISPVEYCENEEGNDFAGDAGVVLGEASVASAKREDL